MNCVSGIYRNGQVVLDGTVDWAEEMQVTVVCDAGQAVDKCVDGSDWEDTPEARHRWAEWFDALEPVFEGDELARFEAALRAVRQEQRALAARWQKRTDSLIQ